MSEIGFFLDNDYLYDRLRGIYSCNQIQLENIDCKLAITDRLDAVQTIANKALVAFVLSNPNGFPLLNVNSSQRRLAIGPLKSCEFVITHSNLAAQQLASVYKIKPFVQPIFKPNVDSTKEYLLFHKTPESIKQHFKGQNTRTYTSPKDLASAFLYVDCSVDQELHNLRMAFATSYGVPSVALGIYSNSEMSSSGDTILDYGANEANWINAIKIALRDKEINSELAQKARQRFLNMGDLERRINKALGMPNSSQLPRIAKDLQAKKTIEDKKLLKKVNHPVGRRETLAEKERRNQRLIRNAPKMRPSSPIADFTVLDTPTWFNNNDNVDVSIIVPMYKSRKHIEKQIETWDLDDDGLTKEIIYVDDLCPLSSYETIVSSWEKRLTQLKNKPVGKVIKSDVNRGYGPNCNLGAKFAKGKYLIFLNADVVVTKNWIKPLFDLMEADKSIGVVGNMQIKANTANSSIDSLGSEWTWHGGHFEHIGKHIHNGKILERPYTLATLPDEVKFPAEREMVTGCCFIIPTQLFLEIGGYDEAYKIGYWEDSDMNMAVKEKGYKIYFHPDSKVIHSVGHSKAGGHPLMRQNKQRFYRRWVHTGFVDNIIKDKNKSFKKFDNLKNSINGEVVGCIIACNEEEFLEASVRSIDKMASRYVFVIGGNQYAYQAGMCDARGYPNDNTLAIAKDLAKDYNAVVIEPPGRLWHGKTEMRNAYIKHLKEGNWVFTLDGDEIYKEGQLWILSDLMQRYECLRLQYYLFWNNLETIGVGAWEQYPQERMVKWKNGYHYFGKNHLSMSGKDNKEVAHRVPTYEGSEKLFYHYSWVRPIEKIKQKVAYYQHQLKDEWNKPNDVCDDYVNDIFLKWRNDPKTVPYTHPRGSGGATKFAGIHPYEITKLVNEGKLTF